VRLLVLLKSNVGSIFSSYTQNTVLLRDLCHGFSEPQLPYVDAVCTRILHVLLLYRMEPVARKYFSCL